MKNRGITLIALVVTIVVLLILAGVSISMLTGENGIITQAQEAKKQTKIGEEKDAIAVAYNGCKINNAGNNVTSEALETELKNNGENASVEADGDELIITFLETNNKYIITETGKVEYQEPLTVEEAEKIISAGLINETYMYVETAGGEVRLVENVEQIDIVDEVHVTGIMVITTNGIRKKETNCFIDKKGKVYTWGNNEYGQLGNGTVENSNIPICISELENDLKGKVITDIITDGYSVTAKDNDGKIYTWGNNEYGQLGNGTVENSNIPICISELENDLKGKVITDIDTDGYGVMAKDNNGKIYTWGNNLDGRLGNGTTENSSKPICISELENDLKGKEIIDIIINGFTVIVKDNDKKIYTWGNNWDGQLGDGTTEDSSVPICISELENDIRGKVITDIFTDGGTVIAKDENGKIYTWGCNYFGELGNGKKGYNNHSNVPICISELENDIRGKVIADIFTNGHTVIAKDKDGKIYTWGYNCYGQLGNGTTENSSKPICISELENDLKGKVITDIVIDYDTLIAKDENGKIYACGSDYNSVPICLNDMENSVLIGKNITNVNVYKSDGCAIHIQD